MKPFLVIVPAIFFANHLNNVNPAVSASKQQFGSREAKNEEIRETTIQFKTENGKILKRAQHYVYGYPVLNSGGLIIVEKQSRNWRTKRSFSRNKKVSLAINNVDEKVGRIFNKTETASSPTISHQACQSYLGDLIAGEVEKVSSTRYIYHRQDIAAAVLVDEVVIAGISPNRTAPFVYHCIYDTKNHLVLLKWSGIRSAVVLNGGNLITGPYQYGKLGKPTLPYIIDSPPNDRACRFKSRNGIIEVFNARSQLAITNDMTSTFDCIEGPKDGANGGYGPQADTFYNSLRAAEMFLEPSWGGLEKIVSTGNLKVYAHYGNQLDDAFFRSDTKFLYVGDGNVKYYPLGTCLDLIAHEIAHSITDMYSNLMYLNESGCLGEAFSDMMAEMAKNYDSGAEEFIIAKKCMKTGGYLRDMTMPVRYPDFFPVCINGGTSCQESHICAAIPSFIFYKLATSRGWSIRLAGRAFLFANKLAWYRQITIKQAGCDVCKIVRSIGIAGGDTNAVIGAWSAVSLDISDCCVSNDEVNLITAPTSTTTTTTTRSTTQLILGHDDDLFQPPSATLKTLPRNYNISTTNTWNSVNVLRSLAKPVKTISNCSPKQNLSLDHDSELLFVAPIPATAKSFNIKCNAISGDPDLYFSYSNPPTQQSFNYRSFSTARNETITGLLEQKNVNAYIMIHNDGPSLANGLWLYVCFS